MKYANYYVDYIIYVSLLGRSLFVAFGKSFLGFRKIFTPDSLMILLTFLIYSVCSSKGMKLFVTQDTVCSLPSSAGVISVIIGALGEPE